MALEYHPQEIERKWQEKWASDRTYEVEETANSKYYALTMFPYTSGDLHIGHWYAMAPSDVRARFKRMQGYNVLHPMGFDAFGLPAENAAISRGVHPYTWTMNNVENMRRQLKSMGSVYDWNREVISCLPDYYKWSQWFFLQFYKAGLAYRAIAPVNWCPECQTILAREQVLEGACWRCQAIVKKRDLEQWFFRITRYAEELLNFNDIDWPERIKLMQRNWIGKSLGCEIAFGLEKEGVAEKEIRVFTTRPDTIFGVTFFVLAPEHPLVPHLTSPERKAQVEEYIEWARLQTEFDRTAVGREKTGVFLGSYVINKLNGEKVPVWISDYVLPTYGTGAVMAVPAHDERDFEFARKFGIQVKVVVAPPNWDGKEFTQAYTDFGVMVNCGDDFDGMSSGKLMGTICDILEERGWGKRAVTYRLRDWLISRQRYWGAPIPIIYCDKCGIVPVPDSQLPVLLPPDAEFKPTGESPLKYVSSFVNTSCPACGSAAKRETDTMDTFMCSSWYFLRYTSPQTTGAAFDSERVKYWMPVDLYTGGAEHATMHLLYARFFTKALRGMGLIGFGEPFTRLFNQGTVIYRGEKMSKSRGNVVTPDVYVSELGADTVRAYLMFLGPWELGGEWNDSGINGISRWFNRVWRLGTAGYAVTQVDPETDKEICHWTHKTTKKVTQDLEQLQFNTMLAALMEFTNYLVKVQEKGSVSEAAWREALAALLLLLAPTAPHLTEELWGRLGCQYSIHNQRWPKWDEALAREKEITLVIQVNGRLRDKVSVPVSISEKEATDRALSQEKVKAYVQGNNIDKLIYVPGRLLNIVLK